MIPVLPAFAGHVPQKLERLYPDAKITHVSYWGGFALDTAWKTGIDDNRWIERLTDRLTGFRDETARAIWRTLCDSVYTQPVQTGQSALTNAHPSLEGN